MVSPSNHEAGRVEASSITRSTASRIWCLGQNRSPTVARILDGFAHFLPTTLQSARFSGKPILVLVPRVRCGKGIPSLKLKAPRRKRRAGKGNTVRRTHQGAKPWLPPQL
jgi:hypothetical protein